jgi:hypothetical protein
MMTLLQLWICAPQQQQQQFMGRLFVASILAKINPMHPNDGCIH